MVGEGGVSGDDVTWVITSSGPLKCEYFAHNYINVYGGSRCERVEERERGGNRGVSRSDVTYLMTSSGPPKCVYLMFRWIQVYWETRCERCE